MLLTEAQQYMWGGPEMQQAWGLEAQLQKAKQWAADVTAASRGKPTLERVAQLLEWDPPPVAAVGLARLKELSGAGAAWRARYQSLLKPAVVAVGAAVAGATANGSSADGAAEAAAAGGVRGGSGSSRLARSSSGAGSAAVAADGASATAGGAVSVLAPGQVLDLRALSSLVHEGTRLGVELPEVKVLQERLEAAKALVLTARTMVAATGDGDCLIDCCGW